ncbi:MAG: MFS transporter [Actinobacteria bacterium]|nr:MFS transporter [Actinomycetota bacterium]
MVAQVQTGGDESSTKRVAFAEAEALVDEITADREELREQARAQLGISGLPSGDVPPLRETLKRERLSVYPMAALCLLAVIDTFHGHAFAVLAPDISAALGVSKSAIAVALAVKTLALTVGPLPMAALAQAPRRALLTVSAAVLMSITAIGSGYVTLIWGLLLVLVLDGLTTGAQSALHRPLIMDYYPPEARVRGLTYYQAFDSAGSVVGPLAVALLAGWLAFTWRGVFVMLGVASLVATLFALRLRDPGFGRWDTDQIRQTVLSHHGADEAVAKADVELGFFEIARRLLMIPTIRRILTSMAIIGVLLIPFQTFLFFFLEERWNLGPGGRGLFFAFISAVQMVVLWAFAKRGERMFQRDPSRLIDLVSVLLAAAVVVISAAALSTNFALMVGLFGLAWGLIAIFWPALMVVMLSVIPSRMRPHAGALAGVFLAGVGGMLGAIFLAGIDRRYGVTGTIMSLLIPGVVGSLVLRTTKKLVMPDLDRMIDEVIEETEVQRITAAGGQLPMLACRGIDFSYGQLQVLFDVDFTCDHGEIVALLGVNGAGKSTLLRVISGLGLPSTGSVRFHGQDITYLDAERRMRLGISQVPGGRAVFGPMSVVDNLRLFGYTLHKSPRALDAAIDASFAAFPRLGERRNQLAATLSGGEQQMLGLSRALILKPQLLLIDELSLGLAPVIVEQLLDMVRQINATGTAVILVEQSVNIALSLVDHAYFMEQGEMRFDGKAADLLARDDLLRAVFLEGASKGTTDGRARR